MSPALMELHPVDDFGAMNVKAPKKPISEGAAGSVPYCLVTGSIKLSEDAGDRANVAAMLPAKGAWNGKILQVGCGGNCGTVFMGAAPLGWVRQGYAIWATDDGHRAQESPAPRLWKQSESTWAQNAQGQSETARVSAFLHRAVHGLAVHAKAVVRLYYGTPEHAAYFAGCSDGGREALVEAEKYPDDFDGIVSGDPYFDIEGEAVSAVGGVQAQLRAPDAALTPALWHLADKVITERCDGADGVKDGLIQNPAACDFRAERDMPLCTASRQQNCFSQNQAQAVGIALSAITDQHGHVLYPGYPASDLDDAVPDADNMHYWLGFEPDSNGKWLNAAVQPQAWYYGNQTLRYIGGVSDLGLSFSSRKAGWHETVPAATYAALHETVMDGDGTDPKALADFISKGHKLIIYHGLADGDITPYRTTNFFQALAALQGGYGELGKTIRLFAVPGMAHCTGGPGPNFFGQRGGMNDPYDSEHNVVAALDQWVQAARAPENLIATKYQNDTPDSPVQRAMPLCPFPAMAHYVGGDVSRPESWTCQSGNKGMLKVGAAGRRAGYMDKS